MALYMQRLVSGVQTRPLQTTANRIYCAVEGTGTTRVDSEPFAWSRGDVIAVPAWRTHTHHATTDATLFCMTDEPVLRGLGWLRTAP
jgi:gentisate 1,2-dioxygenase